MGSRRYPAFTAGLAAGTARVFGRATVVGQRPELRVGVLDVAGGREAAVAPFSRLLPSEVIVPLQLLGELLKVLFETIEFLNVNVPSPPIPPRPRSSPC